jgi:hypothetical protein
VRRRYLIVAPKWFLAAPPGQLIVVPRPLPAAALVVRRRYLTVVPDACGAAQVLGRGAQVVARGAPRCALQVLDRGAQAVARGVGRNSAAVTPAFILPGNEPSAQPV